VPARLQPFLLALLLAAFAAAPAHAGLFPGEAADSGVTRIAGADLARDGGGAIAYLKNDAGADHVFTVRWRDGAAQPPDRVDAPISTAASDAAVAASNGGRLVVAWIAGGSVYASLRPSLDAGWSAPAQLADASAGTATGIAVDMSINGVAYAVWSAGGDVRGARLKGDVWAQINGPIDVDAARVAGEGTGRPKVAVSPENNAVVVWGEAGHVYGRRVTVVQPSSYPQDLTFASLEGRAGGAADLPEVHIEDSASFAWVSFRQVFDDGGTPRARALAKRLVGTQYEDPTAIDGLTFPVADDSGPPASDMNGKGEGLAVMARGGMIGATATDHDRWRPTERIDATGAARNPVIGIGENQEGTAAWLRDSGGGALEVRARGFLPYEWSGEAPLSRGELGPVLEDGGLTLASDKAGNAVVAWVQGTGRALALGLNDRPPSRPFGTTPEKARRTARPTLVWRGSNEIWGATSYQVLVDGQPIGAPTIDTRLAVPADLPEGQHRWTIRATDRRGQVAESKSRRLWIDTTVPRIRRVRIGGDRKPGVLQKVRVTATDGAAGVGSGIAATTIDWGDRSLASTRRSASHRYRRAGRFTIKVTVTDRAGNRAVKRVKITLR
jgi:PKD domain